MRWPTDTGADSTVPQQLHHIAEGLGKDVLYVVDDKDGA